MKDYIQRFHIIKIYQYTDIPETGKVRRDLVDAVVYDAQTGLSTPFISEDYDLYIDPLGD